VEVVLIDKFVVPEESKVAFLTEVRKSSAFLRTLPGFVEGFVVMAASAIGALIPSRGCLQKIGLSPRSAGIP
jgi:hypothetical protein